MIFVGSTLISLGVLFATPKRHVGLVLQDSRNASPHGDSEEHATTIGSL